MSHTQWINMKRKRLLIVEYFSGETKKLCLSDKVHNCDSQNLLGVILSHHVVGVGENRHRKLVWFEPPSYSTLS